MFLYFGISKNDNATKKIDAVLNAFKSGKQILVITQNNNLVLSNATANKGV